MGMIEEAAQSVRKLLSRYGFIIILVMGGLMAAFVALYYHPRAVLLWDEAGYDQWIYWTVGLLQEGKWDAFWDVTKMSFQYPFLFTWIISAPLLPFHASVENIRLINVMFYPIAAILTYILAGSVCKKNKKVLAFFSGLLVLISPMFIVYGTLAVREMIGTVFTLIATITYVKVTGKNPLWFVLVGLAVIATTMIKYNYGVIVAMALGASEAIELLITPVKKKIRVIVRGIIFICIYGGYMLWWLIFYHNRLEEFIWILQNPAGYLTGLGTWWDHLLFYPLGVVLLYSPSVVLGVVLLASFVLGATQLRRIDLRVLWLGAMINIFLGTTHTENMQERYMFTVVPYIFVLGVYMMHVLFGSFDRLLAQIRLKGVSYLFLLLFFGVISFELLNLPRYVFAVGAFTNKSPVFNQDGYYDKWFDYDRSHWYFHVPPPDAQRPRDVARYIGSMIDTDKPYQFIGESNELSPPYMALNFADLKREGMQVDDTFSQYAIIIDVLKSSKLYTRDFRIQNEHKILNRSLVEESADWTKIDEKEFADLGVYVGIYGQ